VDGSNDRDIILQRIEECTTVINEIGSNPAWKIILGDMEYDRKRLDDNWQNIIEETKLKEARILKMAIMHLVNIVRKYEHDLVSSQEELEKLDNPGTIINKDYDGE